MKRRLFLNMTFGGAIASQGILKTNVSHAQSAPSIQLLSTSPNTIHEWCSSSTYRTYVDGFPYGSWADGPLNPYRRSLTDVMRAIAPHSENRTMYFNHGSMSLPNLSPLTPMTYNSPRYTDITALDMRHWIFSVFNVDANHAFGVVHSENYTVTTPETSLPWPDEANNSFQWLNSLSLFRTKPRTGDHDEFQYAFSPVPFNGITTHTDKHLIIHPAPPSYGQLGKIYTYGFLAPSNPIEDNGYVYFFAQHIPATQHPPINSPHSLPTSINGKAGPVLLRCKKDRLGETGNPSNRNGHYWEIFNQNLNWQYITRWDWADASISAANIKPYVFFKSYHSTEWMANLSLAQAVRKVGNKFVVIGVRYASRLYYSYCSSLSNPLLLESTLMEFGQPPNNPWDLIFDFQGQKYLSVFDPYAQDTNYSSIEQGTSRIALVVSNDNCKYVSYPLIFNNF